MPGGDWACARWREEEDSMALRTDQVGIGSRASQIRRRMLATVRCTNSRLGTGPGRRARRRGPWGGASRQLLTQEAALETGIPQMRIVQQAEFVLCFTPFRRRAGLMELTGDITSSLAHSRHMHALDGRRFYSTASARRSESGLAWPAVPCQARRMMMMRVIECH